MASVSVSGPPRGVRGPPEGHVSQEGGQAEPGGICDDLGQTGVGDGSRKDLPGSARLAQPRRGALSGQLGLPQTHPGKYGPANPPI